MIRTLDTLVRHDFSGLTLPAVPVTPIGAGVGGFSAPDFNDRFLRLRNGSVPSDSVTRATTEDLRGQLLNDRQIAGMRTNPSLSGELGFYSHTLVLGAANLIGNAAQATPADQAFARSTLVYALSSLDHFNMSSELPTIWMGPQLKGKDFAKPLGQLDASIAGALKNEGLNAEFATTLRFLNAFYVHPFLDDIRHTETSAAVGERLKPFAELRLAILALRHDFDVHEHHDSPTMLGSLRKAQTLLEKLETVLESVKADPALKTALSETLGYALFVAIQEEIQHAVMRHITIYKFEKFRGVNAQLHETALAIRQRLTELKSVFAGREQYFDEEIAFSAGWASVSDPEAASSGDLIAFREAAVDLYNLLQGSHFSFADKSPATILSKAASVAGKLAKVIENMESVTGPIRPAAYHPIQNFAGDVSDFDIHMQLSPADLISQALEVAGMKTPTSPAAERDALMLLNKAIWPLKRYPALWNGMGYGRLAQEISRFRQ